MSPAPSDAPAPRPLRTLPAEIVMAAGESVPVPPALAEAIDQALAVAPTSGTAAEWRTAFATALVAGLFEQGLFLFPRAHSRTREAVDANLYSLALDRLHDGERHLVALAQIVGDMPELGPLLAHFQQVIDALTGHAPPAGAELRGALDERLRTIRQITLGVPLDAPPHWLPERAGADDQAGAA
jgi:hypothetical protein